MKKLICFDLDGTLTQHRSPLEKASKDLLDALSKKYKVIMVGAGGCERIYKQLGNYPIDIVGNYGMQESKMIDGKFTIVKEITTTPDKAYFLETADYLRKKYGYTDYKGDSVEFHTTGMVTFALLGTKADIADKIAFDPTRAKRKVMYDEVLKLFPNYTVYIGGSSSFDFTQKQYNKYDATVRWAAERGIAPEDIVFIGDDFADGGGDSHIRIKGMDYILITDFNAFPWAVRVLAE